MTTELTTEVIHRLGKPAKYTSAMVPALIQSMAIGRGVIETATLMGLHVDTLYDWTDQSSSRYKPELSEALKLGMQLYQTWWTEQGRTSLRDREFNHVLWYMQMKNRFGWRDTVDVTSQGMPIAFTNQIPRPDAT